MAQIRIEKKKNVSPLPWILGLLLLGLVAWGAFAFLDDEDNDGDLVDTEEVAAPVAEMATEISGQPDGTYTSEERAARYEVYAPAFVTFMDYTKEMNGEMGLDHEFSHNALSYLADATEDVADAYNVGISDNTERAKQLADEITADPYATNHAEKIRMAAINITETLERIDGEAFGNRATDELKALRKEAQDIDGKTLTLNQKEDVRGFLTDARNVLAKMK